MLTDATCRHATSGDKKICKLADTGGLYLWVYADGRKYWRLRYWLSSKEKSLSLGVYPRIGLKEARSRRDVELKHLDNNLDPAAERRAAKVKAQIAAENSFEAVAREWHKTQVHRWVPTHAADVMRRLELNAFPDLARRPIADIDAPELLAAIRKMEKRGAYDLAHRVLQVCGHGFRAVASTILNETGFRADVIERQLAHAERDGVRGAYNRAEYLSERTEMMQAWADYLDAVADGANVLRFKAGRG